MMMEWPGVSQQQYDNVMSQLHLDATPPAGAIFHVAGFHGGVLRVLDIWESQQAFERFQQDRLTPVVQKVGLPGTPKVQFFAVHNIFAPDLEVIRREGTSSLPKQAQRMAS
jgi:hypothetical protein